MLYIVRMRVKHLCYILVTLLFSGFVAFTVQQWKINNNFSVHFKDRFAEGVFESLKGSIIFDTNHLANSRFDVSVDVNSINTGNKLKNKHARGQKWFDAEKYPVISFISDSIFKKDSLYFSSGLLKIKDSTKKIEIPFTFYTEGDSAIFRSTFSISREDFGIGITKGDKRDSTLLTVTVPVSRLTQPAGE